MMMVRQMQLAWALARNDWRLFLADRRAAVLCFVVPVLLASAFGLIFDGPSRDREATRLPLLIVNEDDAATTVALVQDLLTGGRIDGRVVSRAEAERAVARRDCGVAVVFPAGFAGPGRPSVEVLHHPLAGPESQWAEGVVTELVLRRAARTLFAPMGVSPEAIGRPFDVQRSTLPAEAERPFNAYSHSFCGMTIQYLLFWGLESGLIYLRERQRGLWRRMRAAPVPLGTALAGRALATASIALLQIATTFLVGRLLFGVTVEGSWVGFVGLAVAVSLLAAATGLGVAAVGGTEARARSMFIVVILTLSLLGGLWLPAFLLPAWVRDVAAALPTTWAMRGLDGATWQGTGLAEVGRCALVVAGFALGFFGLALLRFRWADARRRRGVTT